MGRPEIDERESTLEWRSRWRLEIRPDAAFFSRLSFSNSLRSAWTSVVNVELNGSMVFSCKRNIHRNRDWRYQEKSVLLDRSILESPCLDLWLHVRVDQHECRCPRSRTMEEDRIHHWNFHCSHSEEDSEYYWWSTHWLDNENDVSASLIALGETYIEQPNYALLHSGAERWFVSSRHWRVDLYDERKQSPIEYSSFVLIDLLHRESEIRSKIDLLRLCCCSARCSSWWNCLWD